MLKVTVEGHSSNVSALEALKFKNFGDARNVRELVGEVLEIDKWVLLNVDGRDPESKIPPEMLVMVTRGGSEWVRTSSSVFMQAFFDISEIVESENSENGEGRPLRIRIVERPMRRINGTLVTCEYAEE